MNISQFSDKIQTQASLYKEEIYFVAIFIDIFFLFKGFGVLLEESEENQSSHQRSFQPNEIHAESIC